MLIIFVHPLLLLLGASLDNSFLLLSLLIPFREVYLFFVAVFFLLLQTKPANFMVIFIFSKSFACYHMLFLVEMLVFDLMGVVVLQLPYHFLLVTVFSCVTVSRVIVCCV